MFHATVERGGIFYRLGVYASRTEADAAKELAGLCLDKFLGAPGAPLPTSPHLRHPSVALLLREPTLERALAKLRAGDVAKEVAACASAPAAPAAAPPAAPAAAVPPAAPNSDDDRPSGAFNSDSVQEWVNRSVTGAAKGCDVASPAAEKVPPKWAEWPPGSGTFATVLSKQNFPARIAVQRSGAWIMGKIFGDEVIADIAAQDNALASKSAAVTVALDDGTAVEIPLRMYHKSPGQPFYLTSIAFFFKKHALATGDVMLFVPSGPRRATLRVIRCSREEAKKVHAAAGFNLVGELAKLKNGGGTKRAAENAPESEPAKRVAPAPDAPAPQPAVDGAAKLPAAAEGTPVVPASPATAASPLSPASAAAAPTPSPAALPNDISGAAGAADPQIPVEGGTAPAALLATATKALADPSFEPPEDQKTLMYMWYHSMAIARKVRQLGYELQTLAPAVRGTIAAEVSAELRAMAPRERDELIMKCYLGSYSSIVEVKKSVQRQAVIDKTVAEWREAATPRPKAEADTGLQLKGVPVLRAEADAGPELKGMPVLRAEAPAMLGPPPPVPPLLGQLHRQQTARPAPPVLVSRTLAQQQRKPGTSGALALQSAEPAWQGTQGGARNAPPPVIRSRPVGGEPWARMNGPQPTEASSSQPLTYVPPSGPEAAPAAAPTLAGASALHRLPAAPDGAHLLPSALQAAHELRSALEATARDRPPAPATARPSAPAASPAAAWTREHAVPAAVRHAAQAPSATVRHPAAARPSAPPPNSANPSVPPISVYTRPPGDVFDGEWMLAHLRTVAVLDRLAGASEALRDAVKGSFVRRKTAPHDELLAAIEGVVVRLEGAAKAVRIASGQGADGTQGGPK